MRGWSWVGHEVWVWRLEFMYSDMIDTRLVLCSVKGMEGFAGYSISGVYYEALR